MARSAAPATPWLRTLHRALTEDARAEVQLALRVGVLLAAGLPRTEVARRLEVDGKQIDRSVTRLRATRDRIDREQDLEF